MDLVVHCQPAFRCEIASVFFQPPIQNAFIMMKVALLVAAGVAGVSAVEPAFPGSSLQAAGKIQDAVAKATSSSAYQAKTGGATGEAALLRSLVSSTKRELTENVADEMTLASAQRSAYIMVHERMLKQIFIGGCPREYSGCPVGWTGADGACSPPASYDGYCGAQNLSGLSSSQLEDFAWRCRAQWPCSASCARDFSACPSGYQRQGGSCVATKAYAGPCSPTTNFSGMSDADKSAWASMCQTSFPCSGGAGSSGAQGAFAGLFGSTSRSNSEAAGPVGF